MKKTYIEPQSVCYDVDVVAPIASSDLSRNLNNNRPSTDIDDGTSDDNQFVKGDKLWDSQW